MEFFLFINLQVIPTFQFYCRILKKKIHAHSISIYLWKILVHGDERCKIVKQNSIRQNDKSISLI